MKLRHSLLIAALAVMTALAFHSWADEEGDGAFDAVRKGEIAPLGVILTKVAQIYGGEILEVEMERLQHSEIGPETGITIDPNAPPPDSAIDPSLGEDIIYEIKLLTGDGDILKLKIDARTGAFLSVIGNYRSDDSFLPANEALDNNDDNEED